MLKLSLALLAVAMTVQPAAALAEPTQAPSGNYYEHVGASIDWQSARSAAQSRHADLVTITDAAENAFVRGLVPPVVSGGLSAAVWMGASDDANDTDAVFAWVTGEPFSYTHWRPGEPDDDVSNGGQGDVLAMVPGETADDGTWIDTHPSSGLVTGYVVEWTPENHDHDGDGLYGPDDPDDDNDGVLDGSDNCPTTANDQADLDQDGLGDPCDADNDGDSVPDAGDNCVATPNFDQTNTDHAPDGGDACDPDDDNDGTADASDAYPLDPARSQAPQDPSPTSTPTPTGPSADVTAPVVKVAVPKKPLRLRSLVRSRRLRVSVALSEPAALVVTARRGRKKVGSTTLIASDIALRTVVVRLRRAAVKRGRLRIVAVATDTAENVGRAATRVRIR